MQSEKIDCLLSLILFPTRQIVDPTLQNPTHECSNYHSLTIYCKVLTRPKKTAKIYRLELTRPAGPFD